MLFFIKWIVKFQQGMILSLECQQSISLEPALSEKDIPNKCTILVPAGLGWWGQGNQPGCAAPPPLLYRTVQSTKPLLTLRILRNCGFIQLFPDCPFLYPCSFLVQTPFPYPIGAGREARMVGWSWTREEAGKRVMRSGQHWTRVLGKVVSIVETKWTQQIICLALREQKEGNRFIYWRPF